MRVVDANDSERGAIAVMVAILLVVLLGAAALAVDLGELWSDRRTMVTVTDAAALAAAHTYAKGGDGCASAAGTYATSNLSSAQVTSCSTTTTGLKGTVTVAAKHTAQLIFARMWGTTTKDTHSSTTAQWGPPASVVGLRPFGLCVQTPAFTAWTDRTQSYGPVTIKYSKSSPSDCGANVPGNWGLLDFNGGSISNSETKDWVANGYQGAVTAPGTIGGDTGAFGNSLDTSGVVGQTFLIPLFDSATGTGSGATFHIVGFANVTLNAVKDTGSQANRSLTVTFRPGIVQGTCCGTPPIDTGIRVANICAVNPNTTCP